MNIATTSQATLSGRLQARIKRDGPITFHEWMKAALYDPDDGYYCRSDQVRWGREGDYRTSPERSFLFAATFARFFARLYNELGQPSQWTIVEAGAGGGDFAHGVLQTLQSSFPNVFSATRYVIEEISPNSQARAAARLDNFADHVQFSSLDHLRVDHGVVFSNELLDAFPVYRVTRVGGELREYFVDVGAHDHFEWSIGPLSTPKLASYLNELNVELREGQVVEINLQIEPWLAKVSQALHAGFIVTVDYGATSDEVHSEARQSGTLRGFRNHQFVEDVLARPGEQDLTSSVDWTFVQRAGEKLGLRVKEFERQDRFLLAAGLLDQLEIELRRSRSEADKLRLSTSAREMILPGGMASHFQVLVQQKNVGG